MSQGERIVLLILKPAKTLSLYICCGYLSVDGIHVCLHNDEMNLIEILCEVLKMISWETILDVNSDSAEERSGLRET